MENDDKMGEQPMPGAVPPYYDANQPPSGPDGPVAMAGGYPAAPPGQGGYPAPPPGAYPPQGQPGYPQATQGYPPQQPGYPPQQQGAPPTVVAVQAQPATHVIVAGNCPTCHAGIMQDSFTACGIILAICFFPLGIICCLMMKERRCSNCGATFG